MSALACMLPLNAAPEEDVMRDRALAVIEELASRGLFRERDLTHRKISIDWLNTAQLMGCVRRHGRGVWSHARYQPSRYELAQVRLPKLVFWGPSALWLLGAEKKEPEALWVAIGNKSRPPCSLDVSTVIIRTRNLERQLVSHRPKGRLTTLRVHDCARAHADLERADLPRLLERAAEGARFMVPREGVFLSSELTVPRWRPVLTPRGDWGVDRTIDPTHPR